MSYLDYQYEIDSDRDPGIDENRYLLYQQAAGPLRMEQDAEFPNLISMSTILIAFIGRSFEDSLDDIMNYDKK